MFKVKRRNPHPACKIYEGECTCGEKYIGETVQNVEIRWQEHNSLKGDSEPVKHLTANNDHHFTWRVLLSVPNSYRRRKNLEASEIALRQPS